MFDIDKFDPFQAWLFGFVVDWWELFEPFAVDTFVTLSAAAICYLAYKKWHSKAWRPAFVLLLAAPVPVLLFCNGPWTAPRGYLGLMVLCVFFIVFSPVLFATALAFSKQGGWHRVIGVLAGAGVVGSVLGGGIVFWIMAGLPLYVIVKTVM